MKIFSSAPSVPIGSTLKLDWWLFGHPSFFIFYFNCVAILAWWFKRCVLAAACVASIYFLLPGKSFVFFAQQRAVWLSWWCVCWCCCCIIYEAARFCCDSFSLSLEPESWFYLILNRGINRAALDALMAIQVDCFRILFQVRPCEQASASQITQRLLHSYINATPMSPLLAQNTYIHAVAPRFIRASIGARTMEKIA